MGSRLLVTVSVPTTSAEPSDTVGAPHTRAASGAAMAITAIVFVQLSVAASTSLFDQLGSLGTAWLRLAWAGPVLFLLVRPRWSRFTREARLTCVALGVATVAVTMLFLASVTRLPLGTASALEFLGPLGVAVLHRKGARKRWPALAAVGVVLLTDPWQSGVDPVGVALALAAAAGWGGYILLTQRAGDQVAGLEGLAISLPVAAVVATVVAGPSTFDQLTWPTVFVGLGLALLGPVIPFSLEFLALRRLTTAAFGTLMSLEPAVASIIGLLALHQVPALAPMIGIGLVVAAGIGAERSGARPLSEPLPS